MTMRLSSNYAKVLLFLLIVSLATIPTTVMASTVIGHKNLQVNPRTKKLPTATLKPLIPTTKEVISKSTTATTGSDNKIKKKQVLVIGAGPSGLVAIKEMLEAGHDVVAIDKANDVGGVFRVDPGNWGYEKMHLTASNFFMAFSDYPPLADNMMYLPKEDYYNYLKSYAEHFNLNDHIRLRTTVESATLSGEDDTWHVVTKTADGERVEYRPDMLLVATGSNHIPKTINTDGFTGEVVHSSDYRNPNRFKNKRVLVVGSGESASDILHQTAHGGTTSVTSWNRRFPMLAPRFTSMALSKLDGSDYDEAKLLKTHQQTPNKVVDFLEIKTASRWSGWIPQFLYGWFRQSYAWSVPRFNSKTGKKTASGLLASWCREVTHDKYYYRADQVSVATKNSFISALDAADLISTVIAPQASFDGKKVTFSKAKWYNDMLEAPTNISVEVDTIILCTGFKTDLGWLHLPKSPTSSPAIEADPRTWYKHCFPPKFGHKLAFLGWTRPHQGGIPPCSELLARYIGLLLKGERSLPSDYADLAMKEGDTENKYYMISKGYQTLMDYPGFTESLSDLIGCRPRCPSPFLNWQRFVQYWMYPTWPCWYRQQGPGAKPKSLETTLNKVPLKTSFAMDRIILIALPFVIANTIISTILSSIPGIAHLYTKAGETWGWMWLKPRRHVLTHPASISCCSSQRVSIDGGRHYELVW